MQEVPMTNLMIRIATLGTWSIALIAAFSVTPVVAAGGGGGGGGGGGEIYGPTTYSSPPSPPTAYPRQPGTKATQRNKKTSKQSLFNDPAFSQGYRAAYATIYDRNEYADAIEQL